MVRNFLCRLPLLLLPFSTGFAETPAAASSWHPSGAGMLAAPVLNEVSGMAASRLDPGRFWVLNDSGNKPALYAISGKGELLGTLEIEGAKNRDWEDLASFSLGGKNYLLIGDMGDNAGRRRDCRLYLVEEPAAVSVSGKAEPLAVIPFSYEDGPRDVESVALDVPARKILLMSKREKVPALYELPLLLKPPEARLTAKKIAAMESLPQPTDEDRKANPLGAPYLGQPTGMDVTADGSTLVLLTYQDVFLYHRKPDESWSRALLRPPLALPRHHLIQAEAICFSRDGSVIFVTTERVGTGLLLRYDRSP